MSAALQLLPFSKENAALPAPSHSPPQTRAPHTQAPHAPATAGFCLAALAGRIVELASRGASANLTMATRLVLEAQRAFEPVAWITPEAHSFYPPDLAASGVDLHSLVVVRVPRGEDVGRAADQLARSGAFGLLVIDMPQGSSLAAPLLSRLLGLAQKHHTAVLCLTEHASEPASPRTVPRGASLGSLVSLRAEARLSAPTRGSFVCQLHVTKDKRRSPGWTHEEVCRGPAGMR